MEGNRENSASPAAVESAGDDNPGVGDAVTAEFTARRNRETALKRPMISDPESDDNQELGMYKLETHKKLFDDIQEQYKKLMYFMGLRPGWMPRYVAEKRLRTADLAERLVIPARSLRFRFLSKLDEEELKQAKRLPVEVADPLCSVSLLTLTAETTAEETTAYVISDWSEIVERNRLEEGDLIDLWCFHVGNGLCFLILLIDEDD